MKIKSIDINNFRKLKKCRIEFSDSQTLFVGANNSGKTSAIDALICFLGKGKYISSTDFTLCNWKYFNSFADSWLNDSLNDMKGLDVYDWLPYCPSLDVWIEAKVEEVHKIAHLIPTLKWNGEPLGIRIIFQPKNIDKLKEDYIHEKSTVEGVQTKDRKLSLWPRDFKDYLNKKLSANFEFKAYPLDSTKNNSHQILDKDAVCFDSDPFQGIFKVDTIEAQRGFSDPNAGLGKPLSSLSSQLNDYYNRHVNLTELPGAEDIDALEAIENAQNQFDRNLESSFKEILNEIEQLGYSGFNEPNIKVSSRIKPIDGLDHDASVIFEVQKQESGDHTFSLPEQYNGLGYKNLVHIIFKLISFRDGWQKVGKMGKKRDTENLAIEPIHLVLIEEPEAHLHPQVQQVFIRKAYKVLRKYGQIDERLMTQLVISTHSSYIAYEAGFENLRYFKRKPAHSLESVPNAEVVSLSTVFPSANKKDTDVSNTKKFVSRYLKTTHCDLFFANGIILVEGAGERILLPHFIEHKHKKLRRSYISILEIGGAHAHTLKPLIDLLEIPTLIITDTDSCNKERKKERPVRGHGLKFRSSTLKTWFELGEKNLDDVLDLIYEHKLQGHVRVAYQYGININWNKNGHTQEEAIPYTFEDALALTNLDLFRRMNNSNGIINKMHLAAKEESLDQCCIKMYEALNGDKAKMALDLLFDVEPKELVVPKYISEGLTWLEEKLDYARKDFTESLVSVLNEQSEKIPYE